GSSGGGVWRSNPNPYPRRAAGSAKRGAHYRRRGGGGDAVPDAADGARLCRRVAGALGGGRCGTGAASGLGFGTGGGGAGGGGGAWGRRGVGEAGGGGRRIVGGRWRGVRGMRRRA